MWVSFQQGLCRESKNGLRWGDGPSLPPSFPGLETVVDY